MSYKATVLIPIYNASRYLREAIDSVLNQSVPEFQVFLLNDGSTDDSLNIIEHYAKIDPRCKVFSWDNQGIVSTLNKGIELSNTDLIIRMDADDICLPTRFEKQIEYMSAHPECVALGTACRLIDSENMPIFDLPAKASHEEIDAANLAGGGAHICHPTSILRRSALIQVGLYRESYRNAEDLDLFLRLAEIGRVANLTECLLYYRQHPQSIGYAKQQSQQLIIRQAITETCKRRGIHPPSFEEGSNSSTPISVADHHVKWSWWALSAGNIKTARKHAFKAIVYRPLKLENIKLLLCTLRGH